MNLSDKKEFVEKLKAKLSDTEISILVDYKGLDVESMTRLRSELRKEGVSMEVAKNTLLSIASQGTDAEVMKDFYKGPNAIVTSSTDPVAPAKILVKFAEDNEKLEIKVGAMAGKALTVDEIKTLAKMPSREALLGQLLSVINGVPTSFVRVLSAVPGSLLNVLNAIGDEKEAA